MPLRLAVVADIHHGAPSLTKRGDAAGRLMEEFARFAADQGADRVLDLGDRISDIDHDTDLRLERDVAEMFRALPVPAWHLNGNHDRDHLSVAENEQILGTSLGHEVHDIDGWRILLWRADSKIRRDGPISFDLPEADFLWLAAQMHRADRPVLIASHVPVSGHSQIGNYYFERNPAISTYPQADRVRAALGQARVPVVCLSGHVHWNTVTTVGGITHLTQQSLTESFTTGGEPAAAMGILELRPDGLNWQVMGEDPFAFSTSLDARRWVPPLPPFNEVASLRRFTEG
ncbi:MAG: metallophosphoesterase [Paracoccus sp. (in: a-proteobacteria)]|nr:metallophosphoesterase [Paracoccus sp. (in: a-proteobacteria)]